MIGTGIGTATEIETVAEIGVEAEGTGTETRVGEAAPKVLEERPIGVLTGETIVTTIGGTLIDETEKIVEGTKDGMTATATRASSRIEAHQGDPNSSLPRG